MCVVQQDEEEEEEEEDEADMPLVVEQGLGMAAHHQQLMLADPDYPNFSPRPTGADARKKRRVGLVQEHIISVSSNLISTTVYYKVQYVIPTALDGF